LWFISFSVLIINVKTAKGEELYEQ